MCSPGFFTSAFMTWVSFHNFLGAFLDLIAKLNMLTDG